jgi:hypothetical protein
MRFLVGATKAVQTWIVHKNQNYLIINDRFNFEGKNDILLWTIGKGETLKLRVIYMNFMVSFMEATLRDESQQKWFCRLVIIGPPSSKMPMIIPKIMMYVKLMCKGLLWVALYTPYHLWDLLKNGELIYWDIAND